MSNNYLSFFCNFNIVWLIGILKFDAALSLPKLYGLRMFKTQNMS